MSTGCDISCGARFFWWGAQERHRAGAALGVEGQERGQRGPGWLGGGLGTPPGHTRGELQRRRQGHAEQAAERAQGAGDAGGLGDGGGQGDLDFGVVQQGFKLTGISDYLVAQGADEPVPAAGQVNGGRAAAGLFI